MGQEMPDVTIDKLEAAYANLNNNDERRKFVIDAFNNDQLVGKAKDFFIDQFNKGEIYDGQLDEQTALKLASVLKINDVQDKSETLDLDKNLTQDIVKEVKKNRVKLINNAKKKQQQIDILYAQVNGHSNKSVSDLWAEYDKTTFFDRSQRKYLKSMLKTLDVNYKHNIKHGDRREIDCTGDPFKSVEAAKKKLDTYIGWKNTVAGNSFFSKPFKKQLSARFHLLFNRNPEKKVQKLLGKMNTQQMQAIKQEWLGKIQEAKNNLANTAVTREKKKISAQIALLEGYVSQTDKAYQAKNNEFNNKKAEIEKQTINVKFAHKDEVAKIASKLEANRLKAQEKSPEMTALKKILANSPNNSDLRKAIETAANARQEKKVTPDRVFEEIMKESGFSKEQIAVIKKEYVPEINKPVNKTGNEAPEIQQLDSKQDEKAPTNEAEASREQAETPAPAPQQEEETIEAKTVESKDSEKSNAPVLHDAPAPEHSEHSQSYTNLETVFSNFGYDRVEPASTGTTSTEAEAQPHSASTFRNQEDGHTVTVEKTDDANYYVTAKTKDGKEDKAQVDDLVAVMKEMTQSGEKTIELGTVNSPEFLARAELAAEKAGISISNLAEKKKEMEQRGLKDKVKEEKAFETTRSTLRGVNIDVSTKEGLNHAVNKMDTLAHIQSLSPQEYEEYKNSPEFKKLNLNDKETKLFDNVNKLKNKGEFSSQSEEKQARILGRLINNYVSSYASARDNTKGNNEKKQRAGREAAAKFVQNNAAKFRINNNGGR